MSRENDKNQGKRNVESIRTEHESFENSRFGQILVQIQALRHF